jgi:hypothetical protein
VTVYENRPVSGVDSLVNDARAEQLGKAAFVEDARSGKVLQATGLPACW